MRLRDEFLLRQQNLGFFDANCWVGCWNFPDGKKIIRRPELKKHLGKNIREALISNRNAVDSSPVTGNKELAGMLKKTKNLFGTAVLLPEVIKEVGDIDRYLNWMQRNKMVAVRIFPEKHSFAVSSPGTEEILAKLSRRKMPLLVWNTEIGMNEIEDVCLNFPKIPLVLEMGEAKIIYDIRACYALMKKYDNFHLGMHGLVTAYLIEDIVGKFGANRLIFGSGFPWQNPCSITMLVTHGEFDEDSKRLLAGGNIRKMLGL